MFLKCPKCGSTQLGLTDLSHIFPEQEGTEDIIVIYCKKCKTLIATANFP